MSILMKIEQNYSNYTNAEKKVYKFLNNRIDFFLKHSITQLAQVIGVSEATITRFTYKTGATGFHELRFLLAQEIQSILPKSIPKTGDILSQLQYNYQGLITQTYKSIEEEHINILCQHLSTAKYISLYGTGSSGLAIQEIAFRLYKKGFSISAFTEDHYIVVNSSLSSPLHLVIGISLSGVSGIIIKGLQIAKNQGAFTCSITNYSESLLAKTTALSLVLPSKSFLPMGHHISPMINILFLFDYIITKLQDQEKSFYDF